MEEPIYKIRKFYRTQNKNSKNYYRNTSSYFGSKAKEYILNRDGSKCDICNSELNLQIDHIYPVIIGFENKVPLEIMNDVKNLRILCKKCNSSIVPKKIYNGFVYEKMEGEVWLSGLK